MKFRVEAVNRDTFNVWVEGSNAAVADGARAAQGAVARLQGRARQRRP